MPVMPSDNRTGHYVPNYSRGGDDPLQYGVPKVLTQTKAGHDDDTVGRTVVCMAMGMARTGVSKPVMISAVLAIVHQQLSNLIRDAGLYAMAEPCLSGFRELAESVYDDAVKRHA